MWRILVLLSTPVTLCAANLPTSEVAVFGRFASGPIEIPVRVDLEDFASLFSSNDPRSWPAELQVQQFFRNGGSTIEVVRLNPDLPLADALAGQVTPPIPSGLGWLATFTDLGLLLIPEISQLANVERNEIFEQLREIAEKRHFTLILDPPDSATTVQSMTTWMDSLPGDLDFAALYFPRVLVDPAAHSGDGSAELLPVGPSGSVAGRILQNDAANGIWNSPAGADATIVVEGLERTLSSTEIDLLNVAHVNPIRDLPSSGIVLFGARSLDRENTENRYLAVVRAGRWITHSLQRSLTFAAFEENDSSLWASVEAEAEAFLMDLYMAGAFPGAVPRDAFFVRCDATTTTSGDIANRKVNLIYGIAPLSPTNFQVRSVTLETADPTRVPPETSIVFPSPVAGETSLYYPTSPGFHYTVEESTDLSGGSWGEHEPFRGDGSWRRFPVGVDGRQKFFRVRTE